MAVADREAPVARPERGRFGLVAADGWLLVAVVVAAAAIRWPNLWLIPTFSDETREAKLALAIFRGEATPLTNFDPYIGALWNYLIALGFALGGPSPWLPRMLAFLAGVATVAATWWLGHRMAGRIGGIVAASLMATNATHVLVNSHVGWSHATTPLFTTLGFACLTAALTPRPARSTPHALPLGPRPSAFALVAAGALLGLGVQTHASAALLLPGAALALLLRRPALLRDRSLWLAALAFLVTLSNLIAFNVMTGGGTLRAGQAKVASYTGEETGYDTDSYVGSVGRLAVGTSWVLSGAVERRRFVGEDLLDPMSALYVTLAVGSLLWAARRGHLLPLAVATPYVLILPLVNPKYEPLLNGRYIMPLVPLVYASISLLTRDAWRAAQTLTPARARSLTALGCLALAILIGYPAALLARYELTTPRTNQPVIDAYHAVLAHRAIDDVVLLDRGIESMLFMAGGSAFAAVELFLETGGIPYQEINARPSSVSDALAERSPRLIVLDNDKIAPLRRAFTLTRLWPEERGAGFSLYRIASR